MRRLLIALVITLAMITPSYASSQSDYDLAKAWANKHCKGATIEKVNTTAKGGYKGIVTGAKYTVKYPKKVKKGTKVKVYFVEKKGDIKAMVCLGKVK